MENNGFRLIQETLLGFGWLGKASLRKYHKLRLDRYRTFKIAIGEVSQEEKNCKVYTKSQR